MRTVLIACALCLLASRSGGARGASVPAAMFGHDIRPLLDAACAKCHGAQKHKGGVDFSAFSDDKSVLRQRKMWRKAVVQVETMEMPPEGEKQLTLEQREQLLGWMKTTAAAVDCDDPADRTPGPSLIRRLNRAEYNLTVRDLVGIDFDAGEAVGMPEDIAGHGYANLVNALILPPALMEKYFAAADQVLDRVTGPATGGPPPKADPARTSQAKRAFEATFFAGPGPGVTKREAARQVVARFARRAYRRPVGGGEVDRLMTLFDLADGRGERFEAAVRLPLKAVLVSPHFLFRVEQDRAPQGSQSAYRVGDGELACRLSYFLWSSMPDEALFSLAEQNKLSDPALLESQVRRMLADPKARALTDNFAAQWLQLRKLADARPSTEFFPTFTPKLRQAMYDEAATFFDKLREEDRSLLELLDADYTYVNEDLARHYGLPGVKGAQTRRVALAPADHRGGLLGMGGVLAMTSASARTSPTLRGKYVLEVVLGAPPPPPPPDAGMFKEQKDKKAPKTFREQMALHASQPACAACHKRIDPLGYGLENYDAVGSWRETAGGGPLDNFGQLPGGEKFNGPAGLKQVLLARRDDFVRNAAEQMLTYALGRELQYFDDCPVKDVKAAMEKDGYRFSSLVLAVVKSYPFQYRKNIETAEGAE